MEYLQITDENLSGWLELFQKELDSEGYIIDKETKKRLVCPYLNEEIHSENFSILSEGKQGIFVRNYSYVFARHIAKNR